MRPTAGKRRLAARPEEQPLRFVLATRGSRSRPTSRQHAADLAPSPPRLLRACRRTRPAAPRRRRADSSACTNCSTARVAGWSIISRPAGMMPAAMIAPTAAPAFSTSSNAASATCASCGFGSELDGDLGDDGEQPFAAVDQRQQVVARRVERVAAELDDLAGDEHAAHAAHVVHREPVLEAMHAAGVLGDVAADRARDLRRRVGRVVEAVAARPLPRSRGCARRAARPRCARAGRWRGCA